MSRKQKDDEETEQMIKHLADNPEDLRKMLELIDQTASLSLKERESRKEVLICMVEEYKKASYQAIAQEILGQHLKSTIQRSRATKEDLGVGLQLKNYKYPSGKSKSDVPLWTKEKS